MPAYSWIIFLLDPLLIQRLQSADVDKYVRGWDHSAIIRDADWIVHVDPAAGEQGGQILYSGLPDGLRQVKESVTRHYIYEDSIKAFSDPRIPKEWLTLKGVSRNNLVNLKAAFPIGVMTSVSGVSGSGKSSLVSQVLVELVAEQLGLQVDISGDTEADPLEQTDVLTLGGRITVGMKAIKRLVVVDQKPIGRTPRSNLATYTGLFNHVRKLFAATPMAKASKYDAGRFSFNLVKGRCPHCEGEGMVMVELLFLPSVYTPCPTCNGRFNPKTLAVKACFGQQHEVRFGSTYRGYPYGGVPLQY